MNVMKLGNTHRRGHSLGLLALAAVVMSVVLLSTEIEPVSNAEGKGLRTGISYGGRLMAMSDDSLSRALDDAVAVGASWIRTDLAWRDIQPDDAADYQWARFDRLVDAADKRNLRLLPVLAYPPQWAVGPDCDSANCPPADAFEFAEFARRATLRYAPRGIHTWEIWNEQNSNTFWQSPDPMAYARLLRLTAGSIKGVDARAYLILGGLAMVRSEDKDISLADFIDQPGSPLDYVNAIAVHPYTYPFTASRLGPWGSPWLPRESGMPYIREAMQRAGHANLPIWITEYGAPTNGSGAVWKTNPENLDAGPDHVSEADQAAIATDAVSSAVKDTHIRAFFWYTDADFDASASKVSEDSYGLRRANGTKKPSFAALAAAFEAVPR